LQKRIVADGHETSHYGGRYSNGLFIRDLCRHHGGTRIRRARSEDGHRCNLGRCPHQSDTKVSVNGPASSATGSYWLDRGRWFCQKYECRLAQRAKVAQPSTTTHARHAARDERPTKATAPATEKILLIGEMRAQLSIAGVGVKAVPCAVAGLREDVSDVELRSKCSCPR
jgi:hypothetical protein